MIKTRWFAFGALGALLVAYGVGCGGSTPVTTGAGGAGGRPVTSGTAGTGFQGQAGDNGQAGTFGGQGQAGDNGQAGTFGGQAGTGGGQAGTPGGNTDGGAPDGRRRRDGGGFDANFDAIIADILGNRDGFRRDGGGTRDAPAREVAGFDANLPACDAAVMDGGACTRGTSVACKPATGNACICRNNTWACF